MLIVFVHDWPNFVAQCQESSLHLNEHFLFFCCVSGSVCYINTDTVLSLINVAKNAKCSTISWTKLMKMTNKNIFSGLIEKKTDKPANKYRKDEASHL